MWKGIDVSDNQGKIERCRHGWAKYVAVLKDKIDSQGGDENV